MEELLKTTDPTIISAATAYLKGEGIEAIVFDVHMKGMTAFAPDTLTNHKFLGGSIEVKQPRDGYRSGVDAVYLASSAPAIAGESVLDLGTGAGISSFCLDTRVKGLALFALEVQPAYASLAEQNAVDLGVNFTVYRGDVRHRQSTLSPVRGWLDQRI